VLLRSLRRSVYVIAYKALLKLQLRRNIEREKENMRSAVYLLESYVGLCGLRVSEWLVESGLSLTTIDPSTCQTLSGCVKFEDRCTER